jgi:hypothetical protein
VKVKDLIAYLQTLDAEVLEYEVAIPCYSDYKVLELDAFEVSEMREARPDGYITRYYPHQHPKKKPPLQWYLVID